MAILSDQDHVFSFLSDTARHPDVRRIDTHAATVFLAADHAYKLPAALSGGQQQRGRHTKAQGHDIIPVERALAGQSREQHKARPDTDRGGGQEIAGTGGNR